MFALLYRGSKYLCDYSRFNSTASYILRQLHVERLPPRCLAFGFEINLFRKLDEQDVVSKWFLVGGDEIIDFSKYLSDKLMPFENWDGYN
jgi:hypothetical protein